MRKDGAQARVYARPRHDVVGNELPLVVWIDEHCGLYFRG